MYKLSLLIIVLLFSACGGGGGSTSTSTGTQTPATNTQKGFLVDSAISGIEYECDDIKGVTKEDGEFEYKDSCKVIFSLGKIKLGEIDTSLIKNDKNVTPAEILGLERENVSDDKLINLVRFLQSIDEDDNPNNNGIVVAQNIRDAFKDKELNFLDDSMQIDKVEEAVNLVNKNLVNKRSALEHYENTLKTRLNVTLPSKISVVDVDSPVIVNEKKGFSYETQRVVNLTFKANSDAKNKQILLYERKNTIDTPAGELEQFGDLIISTNFNENAEFTMEHTFANHIQDIWLVVPYYNIQLNIAIKSHNIHVNINK